MLTTEDNVSWKSKVYGYQWDSQRQSAYEQENLPQLDGKLQPLTITRQRVPSKQERMMIESGDMVIDAATGKLRLDCYHDEDIGASVTPYVHQRSENGTVIVERAEVNTTCIQGTSLLRTCKQVNKEASRILYGENTFVFDTRGHQPFTHEFGVHPHDAFGTYPADIPGLPNKNGSPRTHSQISYAMHKLFDRYANPPVKHPAFIYRDPLTNFLGRIGTKNASYIASVKIEGIFKTVERRPKQLGPAPIGFSGLLTHVYPTVLSRACPNLTNLTLHQGIGANFWYDDPKGHSGKTDDEKIHEVVAGLVDALKALETLHLVAYKSPPKAENWDKMWGSSIKFVGQVRARHEQKMAHAAIKNAKKANAQKRAAENKNPCMTGIDHSMKVDQALAIAGNTGGMKEESMKGYQDGIESAPVMSTKPNFRKGKKNAGKQRR